MKIGIDLGGSHIGIGVIDDEKNIIEAYERYFNDSDKDSIAEIIENFIVDTIRDLEGTYDIECIGIAVPGVAKDGIILKTVNLGINNYHIGKNLEEKLHKPVFVRNDAKCACLAEYDNMVKNDSSIQDANILFLTIGTGIGGGAIYNGKLLEGHRFEGYEFGHMVIKANGVPCKCGKSGCFERYGSILEYKKKVREILNLSDEVNGEPLREVMRERHEEISDLEEEYISDLSIGISNLVNILEPDIIVLGGGFAHFSDMFLEKIKHELLNSNLLFNRREDIDLRIAQLGNDAGIIGATIWVIENIKKIWYNRKRVNWLVAGKFRKELREESPGSKEQRC